MPAFNLASLDYWWKAVFKVRERLSSLYGLPPHKKVCEGVYTSSLQKSAQISVYSISQCFLSNVPLRDFVYRKQETGAPLLLAAETMVYQ